MTKEKQNQREFFRIKFPIGDEIKIIVDGKSFTVFEISERSLTIEKTVTPGSDNKLRGLIQWSNGQRMDVSGEFGPHRDGKQSIVNVTGIKSAQVVSEQRRLLASYPTLIFDDYDRPDGKD